MNPLCYFLLIISPGLKDVQVFHDTKIEGKGYIGYDSKLNLVIAVFRGSDNIENWINDFKAIYTEYSFCKDCYVHKGNCFEHLNQVLLLALSILWEERNMIEYLVIRY